MQLGSWLVGKQLVIESLGNQNHWKFHEVLKFLWLDRLEFVLCLDLDLDQLSIEYQTCSKPRAMRQQGPLDWNASCFFR